MNRRKFFIDFSAVLVIGVFLLMSFPLLIKPSVLSHSKMILKDNNETDSEHGGQCTIFTVVYGNIVLFGNNEDHYGTKLMVSVQPSSDEGYGYIGVGYWEPIVWQGRINFRITPDGLMNDQGVACDWNSVPPVSMNEHPEKPQFHLGQKIAREAANVTEAIELAKNWNPGGSLNGQLHVADASGDAVIIGPGSDGELVFTRKRQGNSYLVSTNFNRAIPSQANSADAYDRYDTAEEMLKEIKREEDLTVKRVTSILDVVHFEAWNCYTLYSYVFNPQNKTIYMYYMAQFDVPVKLNLMEELAKGDRWIKMENIFPPEIGERGLARYDAARSKLVLIGGILLLGIIMDLILITLVVFLGIKRIWRYLKKEEEDHERSRKI
ncbi:MAG: hypothetical protein ACFFB3_00205 [Candidatus Hodarchaeota archaeon]